jgi:hypothetical protein
MNVKQIIAEIQKSNLSNEDLRAINGYVVDLIKVERRVQNAAAKATLEIGMTVKVNHPKLAGRTFELTEIKRTKAAVRPRGSMFGGYNVPLSLVEEVVA